MNQKSVIRKQLLFALRGGNAHIPIKRAITNFPIEFINAKLPHFEHTPFQLVDHLRRAQLDIINFIENKNYKSPDWPIGFWDENNNANAEMWDKTVKEFFAGLDRVEKFVKNDKINLFAEIPHAPQYTIFREVLVLASHNSYHLGQLMLMRKTLKD
ncbi:MAG: DinB family protein [Ignavibacteriae bacterium]|nr:DinB family protein [Ignavibacteriota bacterium]NOG97616.1 DinB family protein [Ignavibacteriota bacterium]